MAIFLDPGLEDQEFGELQVGSSCLGALTGYSQMPTTATVYMEAGLGCSESKMVHVQS